MQEYRTVRAEYMILLQSAVSINNIVYVAHFPGKLCVPLINFVCQGMLGWGACRNEGHGVTLWIGLQTGLGSDMTLLTSI